MWAALMALLTGVGDYLSAQAKKAAQVEVKPGEQQGDAIDQDGAAIQDNLFKLPKQSQ